MHKVVLLHILMNVNIINNIECRKKSYRQLPTNRVFLYGSYKQNFQLSVTVIALSVNTHTHNTHTHTHLHSSVGSVGKLSVHTYVYEYNRDNCNKLTLVMKPISHHE